MSNVISFHPERRSTWAAKHLQYFTTCHTWHVEHLAGLSDEQLDVEAASLTQRVAMPTQRSTFAFPASWTKGYLQSHYRA